jgi:thiol-disulfide isomerase/thioredoxin
MLDRSKTRRLVPAVLVALLAIAGGLYALYGATPSVAQECRAVEPVSARLAPLAQGQLAAVVVERPRLPPEVSFNGPDGKPVTLGALKGKTVLVNLWATWCVPCREEMPALDKLQAELGGPRFEVVAINVDTRNADKPKGWLAENKISNLAYYADPSGDILQVLQKSGHVVGLPTTFLVDASGCEVALLKGPADWASADALKFIKAALNGS